MTTLTPADLLDKAATHIEIIGWHQGDFVKPIWSADLDNYVNDQECPACAVGAIYIAANGDATGDLGEDTTEAAAVRALAERLGLRDDEYLPTVVQRIGNWNDRPGRTAEQVTAELRACAADLRQGAGQEADETPDMAVFADEALEWAEASMPLFFEALPNEEQA